MILELITLFAVMGSCLPIAHYSVRYLGWKYPEYHQDDIQKLGAWVIIAVVLLFILIVEMAKS